MTEDARALHDSVRTAIVRNADLSVPYVAMNALSTVVASFGLLADSTAVVIGAMVIAMLLGPITGFALAITDGDSTLLRRSVFSETIGVFIVLSVSFTIGSMYQDVPLGREILSRTSPSILDLMIALAGGAAGAYAAVNPRVNAALMGVAIATALVPPLSVSGLCLARGEMRMAVGGFLLFAMNFIAIQFAYSVVLWAYGYHRITDRLGARHLLVRQGVSFGLLLCMTVSMGFNFKQMLHRQGLERNLRTEMIQALSDYPGTHLADMRTVKGKGKVTVIAVVRTPFSFIPKQVAEIESRLCKVCDINIELHIRAVLTKETTRHGYLHEAPKEDAPPQGTAPISDDLGTIPDQ